jgi:hypothetical protein
MGVSANGYSILTAGAPTGTIQYFGSGNNLERIEWQDETTLATGSGQAQIAQITFTATGAFLTDVRSFAHLSDGTTRVFIGGFNITSGTPVQSTKLYSTYESVPFFSVNVSTPNQWLLTLALTGAVTQTVTTTLEILSPNADLQLVQEIST